MISTKLATTHNSVCSRGASLTCFGSGSYAAVSAFRPECNIGGQMRSAISGRGNWSKSAAHVAAGVAVLKAPDQNQIQSRSRNHAQLAEARYRSRQPPVGNPRAHSALNNDWKIAHDEYTANVPNLGN